MATNVVNALQVALLLVAAWTFAKRARVVLFAALLDRRAFCAALREALLSGRPHDARHLAERCLPAWPARVALAGLDALDARTDLHAALEEERLELLHAAPAGIATLRGLARMAPPLAFIGIIVELGRAIGGGYGLAALQRGLPVRLALERGLLTFALGLGTTLIAVSAARVLMRGVTELARAALDVAGALAAQRS